MKCSAHSKSWQCNYMHYVDAESSINHPERERYNVPCRSEVEDATMVITVAISRVKTMTRVTKIALLRL